MHLSIFALVGLLSFFGGSQAADNDTWPIKQTPYTDAVQWDHYSFIINGQRKFLFGGEMHPFRIPVPQLWEDVIEKMKAMGMNSMSFYSHWGYHEPLDGELDFSSGAHNLELLLEYSKKHGIFVTPRPGPYINGELNAGGFPLWITTGAYGKLRSNGTSYTDAWNSYMSSVAELVAPYQIHKNGTVINFQIENGYPQQWTNQNEKVPNYNSVDYMEDLKAVAVTNGIEIPLTHNDISGYISWASDYDTVGAGGNVDVHGSGSSGDWVLLDYQPDFQRSSPSNPMFSPEFQGGKVVPIAGYPDGCADTVGADFRNLYYRHNIDQRMTAFILYMTYGGTSWGWLGVPFLGTSYDYSAPIAEDRSLRDSFYEIKNLALFTRVAQDLAKTDRIGSGSNYTTNPSVSATELHNPDTDARFYVVRHTDSKSDEAVAFQLHVNTSAGPLTVPQIAPVASLEGHVAKILVTDLPIGQEKLLYSTAEVFTYAVMDEKPTLVLWVHPDESGEVCFTGSHQGKLQTCDGCILVHGPSLVRGAQIASDVIAITGDTVEDAHLEVFAPSNVKKVTWNGKPVDTKPTRHGSLIERIQGPPKIELPSLGTWKVQDSLPEVLVDYSDDGVAWVNADHQTTKNSKNDATIPYLYADDYGFHTGSFIYRGRFTGRADGVSLTLNGGQAFGFSVYLNGRFLEAFPGSPGTKVVSGKLLLGFPVDTLSQNTTNVLTVIQDNSGHDQGAGGALSIRGILNATLIGSEGFDSWKLTGTAGRSEGKILDAVRGAYNEAGWTAERLGWHLPGFDDSNWPTASPSEGFDNATVRFYRTTVPLSIPAGVDLSVQFELSTPEGNSTTRALLFVNGYQYGRFSPPSQGPDRDLGFNRFRWPAFASLYEIKVLRDPTNADSEQDPYQTRPGEDTSSLHPIAIELYTDPPISSLKASIDILDHYGSRDAWEDLHTVDRPEDDTEVPCECCDRMPYRPPESLIIRATSDAGVTIGDIVFQVNKYVNDLQKDVLEALDAVGEYAGQRSPSRSLWIEFCINNIVIEEARSSEELEKNWKDVADVMRGFASGQQFQEMKNRLEV
ncbi:putative beta-galactosidase B [Colletotrichum sp. SAR 10_98]|nr:putative beta-galactosidase B [Colletotrichum sp. SAR 10_98]